MTTFEQNDPEASYRRGFQQGAFELLEGLERAGMDPGKALKYWANIILYDWRYGPNNHDREILPPNAPPHRSFQ